MNNVMVLDAEFSIPMKPVKKNRFSLIEKVIDIRYLILDSRQFDRDSSNIMIHNNNGNGLGFQVERDSKIIG